MSVDRFPGNLRIGVLRQEVSRVMDPGPGPVAPKETLLVLLEGHQRFRVDDREFLLSTTEDGPPGPRAMLLRIERPGTLEYLENRGAPLSKVSVTTDPDWLGGLAEGGGGSGLLSGHLAFRIWAPSPSMVALAGDLVAAWDKGSSDPGAAGLTRMARGIELYRAALAECRGLAVADAEEAAEHPKIAELRRYVADHLMETNLGPDELARSCGMGLRSLQRLCREVLGCGPGDFIRRQRFDAAVAALRQGKVSVAQAAFLAGYSSPANFSTAFKRAFGVAPRFIRNARGATAVRREAVRMSGVAMLR